MTSGVRSRLVVAGAAALILVVGLITVWVTRPAPTVPGSQPRGLAWILADQNLTVEGSDGRVDVDEVGDLLDRIPVSEETLDGYDRDAFGEAWADTDANGCDTRNDILRRDLADARATTDSWCKITSGVLDDPYTGATIHFQRGEKTSPLVQIDHIVPLAWAWRHGAGEWTEGMRLKFANDRVELLAVDGAANNAKADRGPSGWLPADPDSRCGYVAVFTLVVARYELTLDAADRSAIESTLATCE